MDSRIRKSLYDKTIDEFFYNPQLIANDDRKNIKTRIIENLQTADQVDIAVSYVVWSGLSLIYDELKRFDHNTRILLTTEGYVSDPTSLRKLHELNAQVKIYNPHDKPTKGFHLKSYCFSRDGNKTILVGSNNISSRAFGLAHEMMVEIDAKNEGFIVSEYLRVFEELWNDEATIELNEAFIATYESSFYEKKRLEANFNEYVLINEQITPNYMQEKALQALAEYRLSGIDKGLVIAATGTGKTYLSAFDVKATNANKVLFLVHNRLILTNAIDTYKKVFPSRDIIELKSANTHQISEADFIFTTDKTAYQHLNNKVPPNYFDYIIFDEAHRIGEDTLYQELINYFTPKFTLGITATPERTKDPDYLFNVFEYSIPYEIRLLDALNHELVCPFIYYGINIDERLLAPNEQFDYVQLALKINQLIAEKSFYGNKLRALLFAANINEAKAINEQLNNIGFVSKVAVSGGVTQQEIEGYIASLKSSEPNSVEIICTVNRFNEGIDIPDINVIIMLRNTESSIIYIQQLGRGLRKTRDPHKFVTVFDLIGNSRNNYSIAQVLTVNETADKRALFRHVATDFETVSPFINVFIEKQAKENILRSISNNFTVKTRLNQKIRNELSRYEYIPTLVDLYNNPYLKELDLVQLLNRSFYEAFEHYYVKKYEIAANNKFLRNFFRLIIQFVFRGYNIDQLSNYALLLEGVEISDESLINVLVPQEVAGGRLSAINSEYNKVAHNFIKPFLLENSSLSLNPRIITSLRELNALELFNEHIALIKELVKKPSYQMETFTLLDKGEFLFNVGARDCYMNAVGEKIDKSKKTVYCTIKITAGESFYDNYLIDEQYFVYHTQYSQSSEAANKKIKQIIDGNYTFKICAQFPHLGYSPTSYFNMGEITPVEVSEVIKADANRYNHQITFKLSKPLSPEFLLYEQTID